MQLTHSSRMDAPTRTRNIAGTDYVDLSSNYKLLPSSRRTRESQHPQWTKRLVALGVPSSACIYTSWDDDNVSVDSRSSKKRIWIPKSVWNQIVECLPVTPDPGWFKGLVRADGYVNLSIFAGMLGARTDDLVSANLKTPIRRFLTELSKVRPDEPGELYSDGVRWIHPSVADYLATRRDPAFAARVSQWLVRAKKECHGVADEHQAALQRVTSDGSGNEKEVDVRRRLMDTTGGNHSVPVHRASGNYAADIVTSTHLIEVKSAKDITKAAHAIGQCSWYSGFFPGKQARVHLFGTAEGMKECQACEHLARVATMNKVEMTFEVL